MLRSALLRKRYVPVAAVQHQLNMIIQYCIGSPRRLRRKLDDVIDHAQRVNKRLKKSRMKASRLKKKVDSLTSMVSALKKENLISSECATMLETTFSGVPKQLMQRLVTQKKKKKSRCISKRVAYICHDSKVLLCKGI